MPWTPVKSHSIGQNRSKGLKTFRYIFSRLVILVSTALFCIRCHAGSLNSWNLVFSNSPFQITSMAYGNGTFVGSGGGLRAVSHDGSNWMVYANAPTINQGGIAFGGGMFLAFGTNYQNKANYILQSTNGTTWTTIYTSSNTLTSAVYGNNTWVFIANNEIVTANITSSSWTWTDIQPSFSPACVTYGNGFFVIGAGLGGYYSFFSSLDGNTWQYDSDYSSAPSGVTTAIAYGGGSFVASQGWSGFYNGIIVSSNLVKWSGLFGSYSSSNPPCLQVAYGGNQFIATEGLNLYTSSNGYTWATNRNWSSLGGYPLTLTYGQGTFVAAISSGNIYQSGVFFTNSSPPPTTLAISTYPGVTINGTDGGVYQIQYNTSLNTNWQTITNFILPYSPYLWVDTSSTANGQRFYRTIQLQ